MAEPSIGITLGVGLSRAAIGKVLHAARVKQGYSLRELSARCQVSAPQLQWMERGSGGYSVERLARVCTLLGLPVAGVLDWSIRIGAPMPPVPTTLRLKAASVVAWAEQLSLSPNAVFQAIQAVMVQVQKHLLTALARSGSPMPFAEGKSPCPAFEKTMLNVLHAIAHQGNAERAAALYKFAAEPYLQLDAWGFFASEVLQELLAAKKPLILPGWPLPEWLASALADASLPGLPRPSRASRPPRKTLTAFGLYPDDQEKSSSMLDKSPRLGILRAVLANEAKLSDLLNRAKWLTTGRGMRSQLAEDLCVKRQAVSQWFSVDAKSFSRPSAESALKLLAWVQEAEGKLKNSRRVSPPREPKTRKKKVTHEKVSEIKSSRRKQ